MSDRDRDGFEATLRSYGVWCRECTRQATGGRAHHLEQVLLRDGVIHALQPDKRATLCGIKAGDQPALPDSERSGSEAVEPSLCPHGRAVCNDLTYSINGSEEEFPTEEAAELAVHDRGMDGEVLITSQKCGWW